MDFFSIVISGLLGLFGLALVAFLIYVLFISFAGDPLAMGERFFLRSKERLVKAADAALEKEDLTLALRCLKDSLYLQPLKYDPHLIDKVSNHHMGVLSRLLIIADRRATRPDNLALIEELLLTRGDLLRSLIEAKSGQRSLARKRSGKVPTWALDEYRKKITEIDDLLATNKRALNSQIDRIFQLLSNPPRKEDQVTYH